MQLVKMGQKTVASCWPTGQHCSAVCTRTSAVHSRLQSDRRHHSKPRCQLSLITPSFSFISPVAMYADNTADW